MNVTILSRKQAEELIANGKFPENTAVISFYDPAIKRIDKGYTHIDYSKVCNMVFYSELDDLDLDVLCDRGYTFDTYFSEADDMARFIVKAYMDGRDIICQCEYGQSRSAGCAAAILECFYHNGITVFADYERFPNQLVFNKLFDALKRQKRYYDNKYYYAADANIIKTHINRLQITDSVLLDYQPRDSHSVVDLKEKLEKHLSEMNMLYHTQEEIIKYLQKDRRSLYASFEISNVFYLYFGRHPDGVGAYFRYGGEKIPIYIYFNRYYLNNSEYKPSLYRQFVGSYAYDSDLEGQFRSLSFFGKLSWDRKRNMIDAVPLIMTNMLP